MSIQVALGRVQYPATPHDAHIVGFFDEKRLKADKNALLLCGKLFSAG